MPVPDSARIVELYRAGRSMNSIALETGRSKSAIRRALAKAGVASRGVGRPSGRNSPKDVFEVCTRCGRRYGPFVSVNAFVVRCGHCGSGRFKLRTRSELAIVDRA